MNYALFILTFASVSFLPGLCMSLALSLGASIGFWRTCYMMVGELIGLLLCILLCGYGSSFVLEHIMLFKIFRVCGCAFLFYTAFTIWRTPITLCEVKFSARDRAALFLQGFLATITNPKAWIFLLSLLPPFLAKSNLAKLTAIILFIELCALCTYTLGGSAFRIFLKNHLNKLSKFSALCVGILGIFMLYELIFVG